MPSALQPPTAFPSVNGQVFAGVELVFCRHSVRDMDGIVQYPKQNDAFWRLAHGHESARVT